MPEPWEEFETAPAAAAPSDGNPWDEFEPAPDQVEQTPEPAPLLDRLGIPPAGGPEQQLPPAADLNRRLRTIAEIGAGLATVPLTGGLPLAARIAATAGVGGLTSLASESFDPSPPDQPPGTPLPVLGEQTPALRRAAGTAARFGIGEGIGSVVGAGIQGLARPLFQTADPERLAAAEVVRRGGGVLPPAQATGRNAARILQGIGESSSIGAARLQAAKEGAEEIADQQIRKFVEKFPQRFGREELGSLIQDSVEGRTRAFMEAAEEAYGAVDDAFDEAIQRSIRQSGAVIAEGTKVTAQPTVSLAPVKAAARELLKRAREGLPGGEVSRILRQVIEKPETVTFRAAQRLRSDLLRVTRTGTELIGGQAKGAAKRISGLVDQSMERSAREAGGEVLEAWRNANAGFKQGADTFNNRLIRRVASSQPEAVVDAILKPNRPGSVRQAQKAIGDARVWQGVQREYLEQLITRRAIDRSTEQLKGQRLLTELDRFGDSAKELIGAENLSALKDMARVLRVTQEQTGKGAGGVGIRAAAELGGLSLILTGNVAGAGLALAPAAVAWVFSNPRAVRILTRGIKAPAGSQAAARAFTQISQIVANAGLNRARLPDKNTVRVQPFE